MDQYIKYIDIFDNKSRTLQDVLDEGVASKTLRENPVFQEVVKRVYFRLCLAQDSLVADLHGKEHREANEQLKHTAKMRSALLDIIVELDGNMLEAENARLAQEEVL